MISNNSVKKKTVVGLFWSFFDIFISKGIQFITIVLLARMLMPEDFGLIGMITIFIAISNSIIDCGFSQALIREKDPTPEDFSTVFIYNLAISVLLMILLVLSAGLISAFFAEPKLMAIIRVMTLVLLINALGIIQKTVLTKNIDFKTQTKISGISGVLSGLAAVAFAFTGFGVWSLVANTLIMQFLQTLLLWFYVKWTPSLAFNLSSFKRLFNFGSKLLASGIIEAIYNNIYYLVIGKLYSAMQLGYFSNASKCRDVVMESYTNSIGRVTYPVLSDMQDDNEELKNKYRKIIKETMFIYFPIAMGLAAIAKPLFIVLFTEKWLPSVLYFQILCYTGMLYPLFALNLNILKVKGRTDIFLRLEIYKKIILTISILGGLYWGILGILYSMLLATLISYFLNAYFSGNLINYNLMEQTKDIFPSFIISIIMAVIVSLSAALYSNNYYIQLPLLIVIGILSYLITSKVLKIEELKLVGEIKEMLLKKL